MTHKCQRCDTVSRFTPAVVGFAWVCDSCGAWGILSAWELRTYTNAREVAPR